MSVNFAAVHDRKPWRKHSIHQTLYAATDGKDGANSLLLRIGRVADMWNKYGDVHCVFVWEDDAEFGQAFRLDPVRNGIVQSTTVPIDQILRFHNNKGCSTNEIVQCFRGKFSPNVSGPPAAEAPLGGTLYPDELPQGVTYAEGSGQQVMVNRYERSLEARNACIEHYGTACQVCGLDFSEKYGELGSGFIHVHHRVQIASIGRAYHVDPINDLAPVCPNCHAMLHRREPPLEIEELRALVRDG
ncbi:HNH endonuclease [Comamonas aquatica]|jgi:hypothetical protein|nr:HNH endonuclease [Comamonas aquatica]